MDRSVRSEASRLALPSSFAGAGVLHVLLVAAISLAIYCNALFNDFVYDDFVIILENRWIRSFDHLGEIFSSSVSGFTDKGMIPNYYRPLIYVYYAIAYRFFGREPFGYHLLNVVAHALVALLVYSIVKRLLRERQEPSGTPGEGFLSIAFLAAVLFATHPIHTEAVDFVGACTELLFALFLLLSFRLYLGASRVLSPAFLGSLACFFASALLKEPGLVLPILIFSYDLAYRRDALRKLSGWARYVPYAAVAMAYLWLRFKALGGLAPYRRHAELSTYEHLVNVFPLFLQYLQKLIWPAGMTIFYPFRPVTSILAWSALAGLAAAVVFAVALGMSLERRRHVFLALAFVAVPLLPALYVSGVGESAFADRYLYLPSVGFALLSATLIHQAFHVRPQAVVAMTASLLVIAGAYSVVTVSRNFTWKDDFTLWTDAARKAPEHPRPYASIGDHHVRLGQLDEAIQAYRRSLERSPSDVELLTRLGIAQAKRGQLEEAGASFLLASTLAPGDARHHFNLGQVYASQKRYPQAIEAFGTALRLRPNYERAAKELRFVSLRKAWSAQ